MLVYTRDGVDDSLELHGEKKDQKVEVCATKDFEEYADCEVGGGERDDDQTCVLSLGEAC